MTVEGLIFCDHCGSVIFKDDLVTLHLEDTQGKMHTYQYHNSLREPCLRAMLTKLEMIFAAPK